MQPDKAFVVEINADLTQVSHECQGGCKEACEVECNWDWCGLSQSHCKARPRFGLGVFVRFREVPSSRKKLEGNNLRNISIEYRR
jgi:hypothetical protein